MILNGTRFTRDLRVGFILILNCMYLYIMDNILHYSNVGFQNKIVNFIKTSSLSKII